MISDLSPLNLTARWTLHKLRPPSRKRLFLLASYSVEGVVNLGNSYRLEAGEPAVAAGAGRVISIRLVFPTWAASPGSQLLLQPTHEITLDHGNDLWTTVHGLAVASVQTGQVVRRGDVLGTLLTGELFFQLKWLGTPHDPAQISRHFHLQDGSRAIGRSGYIREAADLVPQAIVSALRQVIVNGIHYFVNIIGAKPPVLGNIDFNGAGYTGPGVVGIAGDYWNAYVPVDFHQDAQNCFCGFDYGYGPDPCFTYSAVPYVYLKNSSQADTPIWLERIAPLANASGTTPTWNAMLGTWIGGYDGGGMPITSAFRLHGLPPGTYELYLYSNQTYLGSGSDYYVQVDGGSILHAAVAPTATTAWTQNDNYVLFSNLALIPGSIIRIEVIGFLAGLQVRRV